MNRMKSPTSRTVITALALVLGALAVPASYAQCEAGDRVAHTEAGCLDATWTERSAPITGTLQYNYEVSNTCSAHGVVTALLEAENPANSEMQHSMTSTVARIGTVFGNLTQAWCCQDKSDLCDLSDVTPEACLASYERSTAPDDCTDTTAWVEDNECVFTSTCGDAQASAVSIITVTIGEARQLFMDLTTRRLAGPDGTGTEVTLFTETGTETPGGGGIGE